ncbi:MAG TPA: M3 family oligoendopeptidase [Deltaproteobacteria bacterium]|nr:MAG: oligoendopeptidase F [Thermodesulfobacteriota bacterium]HDH97700.1 M3 family oligoendopeptidase [Deltaproteobacteria bacterium]
MNNDMMKELGTEEVLWDLGDLYQGIDDSGIHDDMEKCKKSALEIADKYSGKIAELTAAELFAAVNEYEGLTIIVGRLSAFAQLHFSTHVNDPEAGAFLQRVNEFFSMVNKDVVFFDIEWANVPDDKADDLLADPILEHYRHYLQAARRYKPHLLSQVEEQLIIEISPVGRSSWISLFEKVLAAQRFGKKARTQEEVLTDLYSPNRKVRKRAAKDLTDGLRSQSIVLTHTFNTVLGDKMIDDRIRDYHNWVRSMNLANELDNDTVDSLIASAIDRYDIVQRYYGLKQRLLGLEELFDYDRYAPLPYLSQRVVDWENSKEIVLDAFGKFSPKMASVANQFFDKQWIHAPIIQGKTGGAFAHPVVPQVHPYVLVNFTGNLRDVETVAHELGHGVHQILAGKQGYLNSHTPLVLAETASVFCEMLVFKDLMRNLERPEEKLWLAASKIESIFATVFRQIAMNRFENEVHNKRRSKGELSPDEFSNIWVKTQEKMFSNSVTLTDDYGIWWSYIGHFIHTPGYVYAYAFGELLVLSLYSMYEKGKMDFVPCYLELLAAGGSDTPYVLLESFGIDLHDPDFWHQGLDVIDDMVKEIEELAVEIGVE